MTDKKYDLDIPQTLMCYFESHLPMGSANRIEATTEEIQLLKAECEKILAEAEKPKAWDFGLSVGGLRIHGWDTWSRGSNPMVSKSGVKDSDVHILGNLKDIVENRGPIVVGMSVEDAKRRLKSIKGISYPKPHTVQLRGYLTAALERYEEEAGE